MSFTIKDDLKKEFVELANKNHRSITQELVIAVTEHLEKERAHPDASNDDQPISRREVISLIETAISHASGNQINAGNANKMEMHIEK